MEQNQMYPGWEALYVLPDKHCLRVYGTLDDPEYPYGYDHFGADRALIDGGVFDLSEEPKSPEDVLIATLAECDYPTDTPFYRLDDGKGPIDLEELGFTGY